MVKHPYSPKTLYNLGLPPATRGKQGIVVYQQSVLRKRESSSW